MSATIDDLLAEIAPREKTVKILLRQDLLAEHARRDAELARELDIDARENRYPVGPALAKRLVEFEAEIEAAKRAFRFRAIGKRAWADLLALHPPTKDQIKVNSRLDHNPETFPVAAIAASCVEPVMTYDKAATLEQAVNLAQFEMLWAACLDANVGGGDSGPKSLLAGSIHRANAELERMPVSMASPARSSSAG